jgi:xylan 1,4-beta-xylosidase
VRVRLTNDGNVITCEYSYDDGRSWKLHPTRMEVSGMHHNVFGGFLSLRVGIYSVAKGEVLLNDFRYRGMDGSADL